MSDIYMDLRVFEGKKKHTPKNKLIDQVEIKDKMTLIEFAKKYFG